MRKYLAGLLVGVVVMCAGDGIASRNSAGTYSPTAGIPFVTGTTINSATMNNLISDIGTELTSSLDRSGRGAMLAPLQLANGTVNAPALTWSSSTGDGFYRIAAHDLGLSLNQSKVHEWTATGETITGTLAVTGTLGATGDATMSGKLGVGGAPVNQFDVTVPGTASTNLGAWLEPSLADGNTLQAFFGKSTTGGGTGILAYTKNATAANSTFCLGVFAGAANTLCVDGNNKTTIGSGGTPISKSVRGTVVWNPGTVATITVVTNTITVTGAVAGADCIAGVLDPAPLTGFPVQCIVTADTCNIAIRNQQPSSFTFGSGTFWCRVFNP